MEALISHYANNNVSTHLKKIAMRLIERLFGKKGNGIKLSKPIDSLDFFNEFKVISEQYWKVTDINRSTFGFQIQQNTTWLPGLTDEQIDNFEKDLGFNFPTPLRDFYKTMNGLSKPGINVYGDSGEPYAYSPIFYSYPNDIGTIKENIDWIYKENDVDLQKLKLLGASRIFPVCGHRFMLIDEPLNPILSMYGQDIIYWSDSLSKLIADHIFDDIYNASEFESNPDETPKINYWIDK